MTPVSLILFDLDDTLCAYDRTGRIADLARRSGISPHQVEQALWDSGFEDKADRGQFSAEAYLEEFGRRLGIELSRADWVANRSASVELWPAMLHLVQRLQDRIETALFTTNGFLLRDSFDELFPGVGPLFGPQNLHFSCELGALKSEPLAYRRLLGKREQAAEATLFIDDSESNVAAAAQAGLIAHPFEGQRDLEAKLRELGVL